MEISFKGAWGYAPLLVTLANAGEVFYLVNRPGNAPSHLDVAVWIDRAIDLAALYANRTCARGDTDFALTPAAADGPTGSTSSWARTAPSLWSAAPKPSTSRRGSG